MYASENTPQDGGPEQDPVQIVPEPTEVFNVFMHHLHSKIVDLEDDFALTPVTHNGGGELTMMAVDMSGGPEVLLEAVKRALVKEKPSELIYVLDRYAKPGQGLEFEDFLTIVWYKDGDFHTGVINYKPAAEGEKAIVRDVDWNNTTWNQILNEKEIPYLRGDLPAKDPISLGTEDELTDAVKAEYMERYDSEEAEAAMAEEGLAPVDPAVWCAGEWLSDRLRAHGVRETRIQSVTFYAGRRMWGKPDPWAVAQDVLREVEKASQA